MYVTWQRIAIEYCNMNSSWPDQLQQKSHWHGTIP